ncbi:MAG: phospholipase D-like domain-containing protein [Burkholderiaceae bacterium]
MKLFPHFAVIAGALVLLVAVALVILNFTQGDRRIERALPKLYGTHDPQFRRVMGNLLGPAILGGNRVQELLNGDQIFPQMLAAISGAQRSITFETYIYWSGDIGKAFADALSERARAGVKTHVLLDWVGSAKMDESLLEGMKAAGVEVVKFHQPSWYTLDKMNNRTHRKLLVTDGKVGFTGGVGIAPSWTGAAQDKDHWRDTHFKVEGPAVAQMQATFLDNWIKAKGAVLHGEAYFPELAPAGPMSAQMFSSSPTSGADNMELMYHVAITAAGRSIDLSMAYFVPDDFSNRALLAALQRGVKIRIIVPGPITDSETVRAAGRRMWGDLLRAGAEIHEYQPTMFHCKAMVVDGLLVSVGSTNFDGRSFRLNDEANLNVYDEAFAARQTAIFEDDLKRARRVTLQEWENRPLWERVKEWPGAVLGSQM